MLKLHRIMTHIDTDAANQPALDIAWDLAQRHSAALDIVSTIEEIPWIVNTIWSNQASVFMEEMTEEKRLRLTQFAGLHDADGIHVETHVLKGKPYIELIRLAIKNNCDIVIKDCNPCGEMDPRTISSTDLRLLRKCPCPVWLNYQPTPDLPKRILAAVDVQNDAQENMQLNGKILEYAAYLAALQDSEFHIVQAWEMYGEAYLLQHYGVEKSAEYREQYQRKLHEALDSLLEPLKAKGIRFHLHVLNGPPADVISEAAHKHAAELLVMGTVARTGISGHIIGNTAESVLRKVNCSLLALKPDGFESPVK